MKKEKAQFKRKLYDKYSSRVYLFYEYRGYEYIVTDGRNGYSETMAEQHRKEQKEIDERIEEKKKPIEPYDNSTEKALEWFLNYLEEGEKSNEKNH